MLFDSAFLKKSTLFTEIDLKSLARFCRTLRRPKRGAGQFEFGRGIRGKAPEPLRPPREWFCECDVLSEKDAALGKNLKGIKVRPSSKGIRRAVALKNQISVLRTRNLLFEFFRKKVAQTRKIELQSTFSAKGVESRNERFRDASLMHRVRVTHIDYLLKALATMRKRNFLKIFDSIDTIRVRVQRRFALSQALIREPRAAIADEEEDPEELLQDMPILTAQEKQYLIYKEKKQKMKKLRDVKDYRRVSGIEIWMYLLR